MKNLTFEDAARRRGAWRAIAAAVLALVFAGSMLALVLTRQPKGGAAPRCEPRDLAVVAGDSVDTDVAYVLDACGRVARVPVARGAARGGRQ